MKHLYKSSSLIAVLQYVQILDVPECNLVLGQVTQVLNVSLEMLDKVE